MGNHFEWDASKAAENLAKHGVRFNEAISVFSDALARIFDDEDHSETELREMIVGHSKRGRLLVVSFTERATAIRIISAREATRTERRDYEESAL